MGDGTDQLGREAGAWGVNAWLSLTGVLKANAAANDDVYIYVDGTQNGPNNSTLMGTLANTQVFTVGTNGSGAEDFDGDIAYVRFWTKSGAWTTAEMNQVVASRDRLILPAGWGPGTMRLQWILWDAGTPATTRDWSGNGLTGTYAGTVAATDPARVMGPGGSPRWKSAPVVTTVPQRTLVGVGI